jgi:hypothetical protein
MTKIVMVKNVLDDVMGSLRHLYRRPFTIFLNRPQKWAFWTAIIAFCGLCLFVLLFSKVSWPQPRWTWWLNLGLISALIMYAALAADSLAFMVGSLRLVFPPDKIVAPVIAAFPEEVALVARLAQTYEPAMLAYALDRLTLVTAQLRARIALLIGAVDKVGLIPVAVGAYFPLRALLREQPPTPSELEWIIATAAGLALIYLMAFSLLLWTQRLEEACVVLKHAGQAKPLAPAVGNGRQEVAGLGAR